MAMNYQNITEQESAYALSSDYEHEYRLWLSTVLKLMVSVTQFPEAPQMLRVAVTVFLKKQLFLDSGTRATCSKNSI
jgi:hypothetical protein